MSIEGVVSTLVRYVTSTGYKALAYLKKRDSIQKAVLGIYYFLIKLEHSLRVFCFSRRLKTYELLSKEQTRCSYGSRF